VGAPMPLDGGGAGVGVGVAGESSSLLHEIRIINPNIQAYPNLFNSIMRLVI